MAKKRSSFTTMKIPRDLNLKIESLKLYPREPKFDVLKRLMKEAEKELG